VWKAFISSLFQLLVERSEMDVLLFGGASEIRESFLCFWSEALIRNAHILHSRFTRFGSLTSESATRMFSSGPGSRRKNRLNGEHSRTSETLRDPIGRAL